MVSKFYWKIFKFILLCHFKIEFWEKYNFGLLYHAFTSNLINYQSFKHVLSILYLNKELY
jgi:hypothetical protein